MPAATMTSKGHEPVLLEEVLGAFAERPEGSLVDATFGGGGHSRALLERYPEPALVALDRDPAASARAAELGSAFAGRFRFIQTRFSRMRDHVDGPIAGVLFDLGVSSFHFDQDERGFSFRGDAPVDMRMDPESGIPAHEFLEESSREDLVRAIRDFGEEPSWRRVVQALESARGDGRLGRTRSLAALISEAIPPGVRRRSRIHPATRAFQGIRMAVNDELGELEQALPEAFAALAPGGLLVVIAFHSLEDRMVKRFFRRMGGQPVDRFDHAPAQTRSVYAEIVTRRPIVPTPPEVSRNPRSRSAKLRILRKTEQP